MVAQIILFPGVRRERTSDRLTDWGLLDAPSMVDYGFEAVYGPLQVASLLQDNASGPPSRSHIPITYANFALWSNGKGGYKILIYRYDQQEYEEIPLHPIAEAEVPGYLSRLKEEASGRRVNVFNRSDRADEYFGLSKKKEKRTP